MLFILYSSLFSVHLYVRLNDSALSFFVNYSSDRTQRVKINNDAYEHERVLAGVPQGSNLAPILFSIYFLIIRCFTTLY